MIEGETITSNFRDGYWYYVGFTLGKRAAFQIMTAFDHSKQELLIASTSPPDSYWEDGAAARITFGVEHDKVYIYRAPESSSDCNT